MRIQLDKRLFLGFLPALNLMTGQQVQAQNEKAVSLTYSVSAPDRWTVEHFSLPPEFSPDLEWRGEEEVRLHPDWARADKDGYWSYVFFWWIEQTNTINSLTLKKKLQVYYDGLLNHFVIPNKIPKEKIFPANVTVTKLEPVGDDKETYRAEVKMLSFMTQLPIVLRVILHVKNADAGRRTAIRVDASPKPLDHAIWKELESIKVTIKP